MIAARLVLHRLGSCSVIRRVRDAQRFVGVHFICKGLDLSLDEFEIRLDTANMRQMRCARVSLSVTTRCELTRSTRIGGTERPSVAQSFARRLRCAAPIGHFDKIRPDSGLSATAVLITPLNR